MESKVDSGEVWISGRLLGDLNGNELEQLRRESIGVFQSFHLLPTLTAFESVEFPAQLIGMEKEERLEKVQRLIDSVGLAERSNHLPDALSGGERRRGRHCPCPDPPRSSFWPMSLPGSLDTENGDQVLKCSKLFLSNMVWLFCWLRTIRPRLPFATG